MRKICMAVSHRQNQANIIKFCTFYSLPPTPLILHSSSVLSFSLSLFKARKYMRNFETTHCTPLPASEFHSPWRLWTRMDGWEATIGGRSDWPVVRVCSCDGVNVLLILHQISLFFPPPYDRFLVMCSVAVMASGEKLPLSLWHRLKIL